MWVSYNDILNRIADPPLWWLDGVPRYQPFKPFETSVYAGEALLIEAECQHCGKPFTLGLHSPLHHGEFRSALERTNDLPPIGDPPNHDCDGSGNSMNALPMRITEFWEKVNVATNPKHWRGEWQRVSTFEITLPDSLP